MARSNNRFQKDSPRPLRSSYGPVEFTPAQMAALGAFVAAMLQGGHGCYANVLTSSGTVRLRLYVEGEQWEDNISPRDDFAMLLGEYAKQFSVTAEYVAILGALHAGRAERPQETPEAAGGTEDTGRGGSKRLRPS